MFYTQPKTISIFNAHTPLLSNKAFSMANHKILFGKEHILLLLQFFHTFKDYHFQRVKSIDSSHPSPSWLTICCNHVGKKLQLHSSGSNILKDLIPGRARSKFHLLSSLIFVLTKAIHDILVGRASALQS